MPFRNYKVKGPRYLAIYTVLGVAVVMYLLPDMKSFLRDTKKAVIEYIQIEKKEKQEKKKEK